jgi:hypothetical protein
MALGREQFVLDRFGLPVRYGLGVGRAGNRVRFACRAHDAPALPPGGGREPPGQRGWIADLVQLVHQAHPDALADIVGVGTAEPVPAADRPDQRGVPLDERVPCLFVAAFGAGYEAGGYRIITRLPGVLLRGYPGSTGGRSGHDLVLLSNYRPL